MSDPYILKELSVLYVEDDRAVREVYSELLHELVDELFVASDGEEGYRLFSDHHPDIVVTDIQMPQMDGVEMARKIRSDDPYTPIVITSAHSDYKYLEKTLDIGISGYITKPVNIDQLKVLLSSIAKILKLEDEKKAHEKLLKERFNMQRLLV